MVDYPIGLLVAARVRAAGVTPLFRRFEHDGVTCPNIATVYSDRGCGMRPPVVFYKRADETTAQLGPGDLRLAGDLRRWRALVPHRWALRRHFRRSS
jgi:2-dehydro-3-deoxygluconokinase